MDPYANLSTEEREWLARCRVIAAAFSIAFLGLIFGGVALYAAEQPTTTAQVSAAPADGDPAPVLP